MKKKLFLIGGLLALCAAAALVHHAAPSQEQVIQRLENWPRSPIYKASDGSVLLRGRNSDGEFRFPKPLNELGTLPALLVAVEDHRFYDHGGVDFYALAGAVKSTLRGRRRGASTITAQLVRLARPANRTILTKAGEFLTAFKLERRFTKKELLERYANLVPLGGNARGGEAGALLWFGKPAAYLSWAEGATLAALVKAPTGLRPDKNPARLKARRDQILRRAASLKILDQAALKKALSEPMTAAPHPLNLGDPVLLQALKDQNAPETTTLDATLQRKTQSLLREKLRTLPSGISAAAVVIDSADGSLKAYVPNGRTNQRDAVGPWVDCAAAPRSPGSTLKPFLYGLAFERGLITPSSLLADTPLDFGGAAPRNFSKTYAGPVSARNALVNSLNPPAVRLLRRVGPEELMRRLRLAGLSLPHDSSWYGDSLILGGLEASPLQMAGLAAVLASGRFIPPSFSGQGQPGGELLSSAARWLLHSCLTDENRPSGSPFPLRGWAWKTGTSYGLRDSWTIAWNGRWALAVWFGDPSGRPDARLVGTNAVPTALSIAAALPAAELEKPDSVKRRTVCALSGAPATPACPNLREEDYIEGVSSAAPCAMHRLEGGKLQVIWPADLAVWMQKSPPRKPLVITSPAQGTTYRTTGADRLFLTAEGAERLHWYVDGRFLGTATGTMPWTMTPGTHTVTVLDDGGREESVKIQVKALDEEERRPLLRPQK